MLIIALHPFAAIETTNVRMLYWSMFEVFVLITMGFFQIYYLKRFLEVKSSV